MNCGRLSQRTGRVVGEFRPSTNSGSKTWGVTFLFHRNGFTMGRLFRGEFAKPCSLLFSRFRAFWKQGLIEYTVCRIEQHIVWGAHEHKTFSPCYVFRLQNLSSTAKSLAPDVENHKNMISKLFPITYLILSHTPFLSYLITQDINQKQDHICLSIRSKPEPDPWPLSL